MASLGRSERRRPAPSRRRARLGAAGGRGASAGLCAEPLSAVPVWLLGGGGAAGRASAARPRVVSPPAGALLCSHQLDWRGMKLIRLRFTGGHAPDPGFRQRFAARITTDDKITCDNNSAASKTSPTVVVSVN